MSSQIGVEPKPGENKLQFISIQMQESLKKTKNKQTNPLSLTIKLQQHICLQKIFCSSYFIFCDTCTKSYPEK